MKNRGISWIGLIVTIACVAVVGLVIYALINLRGPGKGKGDEEKDDIQVESTEESNEIIIKIDERDIYINGDKCTDSEDLKNKVTKLQSSGNTKKYIIDDANAIKSTADDVKKVMQDLKDGIDIDIDIE